MAQIKIAVIGGGNMGLAFSRAILAARVTEREDLLVVDRSIERKPFIRKELGCRISKELNNEVRECTVLILAVKPQDATSLLRVLGHYTRRGQIIISLMTGISIKSLRSAVSSEATIIRAMPNLPAYVQSGITVYKVDRRLSASQLKLVHRIMESAGSALEVKSETLLDSATAVSGTGPGYFFYLLESMVGASQSLGFSKSQSEMLLKETLRGTLHLWEQSGLSPQELRKRVASKGGTTNAAITLFKKGGLDRLIKGGFSAANKRAKDLSKLFVKS